MAFVAAREDRHGERGNNLEVHELHGVWGGEVCSARRRKGEDEEGRGVLEGWSQHQPKVVPLCISIDLHPQGEINSASQNVPSGIDPAIFAEEDRMQITPSRGASRNRLRLFNNTNIPSSRPWFGRV